MAKRASGARAPRMPPADRRVQILEAARRRLETTPLDDMSVESVAREAGVSPGLLFHYFGSQRGFRQAVLEAAAAELLAHVRPDPALSPAEQLHTAISTFVTYVARYPSIYRAVTRLGSGSGVNSLHRSSRSTLAGWLSAALGTAGAPATPAVTLAIAGWLAYGEEIVLSWLDDPSMEQEALVDLCERSLYQLIRVALNDDDQWQCLLHTVTAHPAVSSDA